MLRALRRVVLPTLAILLLFATSAAAENAWVLWMLTTVTSEKLPMAAGPWKDD